MNTADAELWQRVYSEFFPISEYEPAEYQMEVYPYDDGNYPDNIAEVWIAVRNKGNLKNTYNNRRVFILKEKVLILGGSYFVGRKIAIELSESRYEVSILNRGTRSCPSEKIEQIICDRNNPEDMQRVLQNRAFDSIIDISWQDIEWVKTLCTTVCFNSVKTFIFLSSSSVYDIEHLQVPFHEEDPLAPNKYWTLYSQGKIEAERYYEEFFREKDTQLVILRPPYIYGEFNYAQREGFIFNHISEDKPVLIPKSNPKLQFIYSGDLADITRHLLENNKEKTVVYNVGNRIPVSSKEWVNLCSEIAGKPVQLIECDYNALGRNVRDFFPFFDYDNVLDVSKINTIYTNEESLAEGLKKTYAWYLHNKEVINFNKNVEQNIYDIILDLNK